MRQDESPSPIAPRRLSRRQLMIGAFSAALLLLAGLTFADWWWALPADARATYVGGDQCRRCHEQQMALWTGSDHDLAMDHARPDTVLGDFDDAQFTHFDTTSRFFRRGEKYFVLTDGPDGTMQEFEVLYVFGVYPLQQYLVPLPGGRLQALPTAWDVKGKRWFHLYPNEPIEHDDQLHWTGPLQNWNYMCADCHSTNLRRNFDVKTNTYHTTWSEIDVSCETCHGPGSLHVDIADRKWFFWDRRRGYALPDFKSARARADNRMEIETCAPCHARRRIVDDRWEGGSPLMDHYLPELMDGPLYYADGQILEEDYEYGSFTQSKMYHNDVACSNCHDPHSLHVKYSVIDAESGRPKVVDNRVCGQCHVPATYDTPRHHHHPDATQPGWLCVDCHMPPTTYMVVDPRRDHSMLIPRPKLTIDLGIPNACNGCHHDEAKGETPYWALEKTRQWYGTRREPPHFAYAIDGGRKGQPKAEDLLDAVTRRKDLSAMVRASAISLLSQYPNGWAAATTGLTDPEPLVRATAVRAMDAEFVPRAQIERRLPPLLHDPLRAVRTEAARVLAGFSPGDLRPADRIAFDRALQEYLDGLMTVRDQPGSHVAMALVYSKSGQTDKAEQAYRTAIGIRPDADSIPARVNLAVMLSEQGKFAAAADEFLRTLELASAERASADRHLQQLPELRQQLAAMPSESPEHGALQARVAALETRQQQVDSLDRLLGETQYSLGLMWAEAEQLPRAAEHLAAAARLLPRSPRVRYNYGLALQQLERRDAAEVELKAAYDLAPEDLTYANSLSILYMQQQQWAKALPYAEQLARRQPDEIEFQARLREIRRQMTATKQ
jgi:tetratricopeptide (TPR) repeat protein